MASTPPMMAPTANVTMAPTTGGTPNASSSNLVFSPFSVFYTIEQTTIPTTIEINELAVFTNSYLTVFLQAAYEASGQILLLESSTVLTGQQFLIGQPVQVDYNSTLTFAPTSPIVPTVEEVTVILASAFAGTNGEAHIQTLRADLSPENIFATTSQLTFQPIVASTNGTSRARVIAGSVSVVAVILMIAVVGVYRRKGYQPIEETKMEQMTLGGDSTCDDHTVDSQSQVSATYRFDGAKSLNPSNMEWIVYQSANDGQVEREVEEHETKNGDDTDTLGVAGENSQE